ncbi:amidohydrolase family protein [Acuticoccus kandeliae]|uniref:amidohydrolase family protein n=1 Tax=Acuticoccus kandeliae TaxID=2073160 RepID=UPI00196A9284|nr:amidohydrolase family protein [Acuticoccus kandeliae]
MTDNATGGATTLLIRRCRLLADAHQAEATGPVDILIENGAVSRIGADIAAPGAAELDATGLLAMPGLVNAHLHSPAAFLKGALVDAPLEIFMLRETPPTLGGTESPAICRARALLSAMEMLKRGITAVHDDAFFNPEPDMDAIDAIMGAYRDTGIRATVALDQPEVAEVEKYPFLGDLLPADLAAALSRRPRMNGADLIDLYRAFIARWHGAEGDRLRCAVSCSAPQRVTADYLEALTDLSRAHDLPFNVHVLETRLQRVLGEERYGKSLVRYLDDLGCLDERKQVIHAVWIDADDIAALARSGAVVAHNPISNLKLGSGVMPFRALKDAGVPICLGTDEAACDDTTNLWGVVKTGALIQKIADPEWTRWPAAEEMLAAALDGGARSLRRDDLGRIAPGARADIALLDLNSLTFLPMNDLRRQLVFAEDGSSVRHVLVDGEIVVRDGRLTRIDEAAARAEILAAFDEFAPRLAAIEDHAARLEPHYRRMYEMALGVDVGMSRWVPPFSG